MGVAGCGKSSLAAALSQQLACPWIEGDAFHPASNLAKMRAGVPLGDADRAGWLDVLAAQLHAQQPAVLACSALKQAYRERLRRAVPGLNFVYLALSRDQARVRVAQRAGQHYFQPQLVDSQFDALEPPLQEPGVLALDAMQALSQLQAKVIDWLQHKESV